jgi:hypothetical protein
MARPVLEEISAEIAGLQEIKAAIDAQIQVLEGRMDETEIHDEQEKMGWPQSVLDAALDARSWLDGEYVDAASLVESWKELAR